MIECGRGVLDRINGIIRRQWKGYGWGRRGLDVSRCVLRADVGAGVHEVDFLLTWNCKHIANPHNRHRIQKCFDRHQIRMPVICTPEEFIGDTYDNDN